MVEIVFWVFVFILLYIYFGYLLLLYFISLFYRRSGVIMDESYEPIVSMIIAAYNEEAIIGQKIENSLKLDYPEDKLEIIVFSDSSTDRTDEIVKSYVNKGIKFLRIEGRKGKTYCKNEAVKAATGEIVVFSDANSMYEPEAIRNLVRHFKDPLVGCVSGELRYINGEGTVVGESIYWRYEQIIKRLESAIGSLTSANGAIYAMRKNLYEIPTTVIDDFASSLITIKKGFKVLYEPKAIAWETTAKNPLGEFHRRVRMVTRATYTLFWVPIFRSLLNPLNYSILAFQLWSHKVLRWLSGLLLIGLFVLNALLVGKGWIYDYAMATQIIFYFFVVLGFIFQEVLGKRIPKLAHTAYYFCLSCIAMLIGFCNGLRGHTLRTWTPSR